MTKVTEDLLYTEVFGEKVLPPQFKRTSDGKYQQVPGEVAPYAQLVDAVGNPLFSQVNPAIVKISNNATNPVPMQQTGNIVKDYWSGSTNITKNLSSPMNSLLLVNDGATDLTITVGALTFTVKSTEVFDEKFDPFSSVTISTSSAYRAWVRG